MDEVMHSETVVIKEKPANREMVRNDIIIEGDKMGGNKESESG